MSVNEVWTVPGVGVTGANIMGDLPWVLRSSGDLLYVAGGNRETVTALKVQTGEEAWQRSGAGGVFGLLYADSDIVAARGYGLVQAFDPISGETLWKLDLDPQLWPIGAFRSEHGLHVLLDRPTEGDVASPQVLTVEPADGSEIWLTEIEEVEHPDLDLQPRGSNLVGGQLLVKSTGALHALDSADGTLNWIIQFKTPPHESYWPTPLLVSDDMVYVADPDGELVAFQLEDGDEHWRRSVAEGRVSAIAVTDELLIYTDGDGTHAVVATSGEPRWSQSGDRATGSIVDGRLIVLNRRSLIGLDPSTGDQLWSQQADIEVPFGFVDLGGSVAAVGEEGILIIRPDTGTMAGMTGVGVGAGISIPANVSDTPLLISGLLIVPHSDRDITAYRVTDSS